MNERVTGAVHLDLDGAWDGLPIDLPRLDARGWGPRLRFSTAASEIERFASEFLPLLGDFVLYGSGDFHHLTAIFLRRCQQRLVLVALDNHPDWDVRPPRWCCGSWVNRALELPQLERAVVWGCGNFECWWPYQIFGNRKAERAGRLTVHPWADDRPPKAQHRRGAVLRSNWREHFADFARNLNGADVYITIDLDCLKHDLSWTNWENGRFDLEDVRWALGTLREHASVVGGDLCGAYSVGPYARRRQRFASETDHPKFAVPDAETIARINRSAFDALWPALTQ